MEGASYAPVRTSPYLTRFECARVLGLRVLQLQENDGVPDPRATAVAELRNGENPAIIRRHMPDASYEDVAVSHLKLSTFLLEYALAPAKPAERLAAGRAPQPAPSSGESRK